jgi:hypothetical protein
MKVAKRLGGELVAGLKQHQPGIRSLDLRRLARIQSLKGSVKLELQAASGGGAVATLRRFAPDPRQKAQYGVGPRSLVWRLGGRQLLGESWAFPPFNPLVVTHQMAVPPTQQSVVVAPELRQGAAWSARAITRMQPEQLETQQAADPAGRLGNKSQHRNGGVAIEAVQLKVDLLDPLPDSHEAPPQATVDKHPSLGGAEESIATCLFTTIENRQHVEAWVRN